MKARMNMSAGRAEAAFLKGEDEEFTAKRWKRGNVRLARVRRASEDELRKRKLFHIANLRCPVARPWTRCPSSWRWRLTVLKATEFRSGLI